MIKENKPELKQKKVSYMCGHSSETGRQFPEHRVEHEMKGGLPASHHVPGSAWVSRQQAGSQASKCDQLDQHGEATSPTQHPPLMTRGKSGLKEAEAPKIRGPLPRVCAKVQEAQCLSVGQTAGRVKKWEGRPEETPHLHTEHVPQSSCGCFKTGIAENYSTTQNSINKYSNVQNTIFAF